MPFGGPRTGSWSFIAVRCRPSTKPDRFLKSNQCPGGGAAGLLDVIVEGSTPSVRRYAALTRRGSFQFGRTKWQV